MPTLSRRPERHVVIDRRQGHYLCFPDVCRADDGRLLVAYNEFDRHVGTRRRLLLRESTDHGRSWSEPRILRAENGHCPRFSRLSSGQMTLSDDAGSLLFWSANQGRDWCSQHMAGVSHGLLDRILELDADTLLLTGHAARGGVALPATRQPLIEQMVYRSTNRGQTWAPWTVLARDPNLMLCEASMVRLPDETILALMRENSFVYEPMYACVSTDDGDTWSEPRPTPLIGHRPTLGLTSGGGLLATYRNLGPDGGTAAWLGSVEELCSDFMVHGLAPSPGNPALTEDGLLIRNANGPEAPARYALRPITDPQRAVAELEARVLCRAAETNGCGLRFGVWWKIFPDRIVAELPDAEPVRLRRGRFQNIRLVYAGGVVSLFATAGRARRFPWTPARRTPGPWSSARATPRRRTAGNTSGKACGCASRSRATTGPTAGIGTPGRGCPTPKPGPGCWSWPTTARPAPRTTATPAGASCPTDASSASSTTAAGTPRTTGPGSARTCAAVGSRRLISINECLAKEAGAAMMRHLTPAQTRRVEWNSRAPNRARPW